jgi:hypothetical protein
MTYPVNPFRLEPPRMSLPSNGITPDVTRAMMPPDPRGQDLPEAIFAALPPPPRDTAPDRRQARTTRLPRELSSPMPADAAQARLAAEVLTLRELTGTIAAQAYAPGLTVPQMCRIGGAAAELARTAAGLERLLLRRQRDPAAVGPDPVGSGPGAAAATGTATGAAGAGTGAAAAAATGATAAAAEIPDINPMHLSAAGPDPAGRPPGAACASKATAAPGLRCVAVPFLPDAGARNPGVAA